MWGGGGGGGIGYILFLAWKGISAECTLFYGLLFFVCVFFLFLVFFLFVKQKAITSNHLCFDHFLFFSPNPGSQGFPSP